MLKTLDVAALRPGMHVQKLLGPWMQHPFWRTSFVVDEERLAQLHDSGVEQVVVDLSRGAWDEEEGASVERAAPPDAAVPLIADGDTPVPAERRRILLPDGPLDFASELARARQLRRHHAQHVAQVGFATRPVAVAYQRQTNRDHEAATSWSARNHDT